MSYNSSFPLYDSSLGSLYYAATKPAGATSQQRVTSPAASSDGQQQQGGRDPFGSRISPTSGHFPTISESRRASAAQAGWPPSSRGTPLPFASNDIGAFGAPAAFPATGGSAFSGDQSAPGSATLGLGPLGQGVPGLPTYISGVGGAAPTSGSSTPDPMHSGLQSGVQLGASNLNLFTGSAGGPTSLRDAPPLASPVNAAPADASAAPGFGAPRVESMAVTNWVYIDLSNTLQGPFSGSQMAEWVAYFADNVMLRREQDHEFLSFGALKELTGTLNPFLMPLSPEAWTAIFRTVSKSPQPNDPQTGVISSPGAGAPLSPLQHTNHSTSTSPNIIEQSLADLNLSHDTQHEIPQIKPFTSNYSPTEGNLANEAQDENVHDFQSVLDESAFQFKRNNYAAETASEVKPAKSVKAAAKSPLHGNSSLSDATTTVAQPQATTPVRADAPVTEPWKRPSMPTVSLAELKQKEMERQKKPTEPAAPRKLQTKSWTQVPLGDETLPSPANVAAKGAPPSWNRATPVSAPKSLAEIQKEAQAKKMQAKVSYSTGLLAQNSPAQATGPAPAYHGRFSALDDVAPGQRPKPAPSPTAATPRAVRTQSVRPVSVTASANLAKPTDELIQWAKISFKGISKEVNPMELLDVFLSLPANNEAKEFIAESIYSYSKTLDGRRFAHDFLNRKKLAEQSMKPGETWKDVLQRFNPTVEQDPSFKVVTNKRVKPITRPESMRA